MFQIGGRNVKMHLQGAEFFFSVIYIVICSDSVLFAEIRLNPIASALGLKYTSVIVGSAQMLSFFLFSIEQFSNSN